MAVGFEASMLPPHPREQMEDAAFWLVEGKYGTERWPVDSGAVYARNERSVEREHGDTGGIPVRTALRDLLTAIRALGSRHTLKHHPDDRVRVNGGSWMDVADYAEAGSVGEGFAARYENGSVLYAIRAMDIGNRGHGTPEQRMRRMDNHESVGIVHCLEVDWGYPPRRSE